MAGYDDNICVGEAREQYFTRFHLDAGGYTKKWVKLKFGPLPFYFPNTAGRVRAAKLHDLHHVATGYNADWTGESEIGAWELASGCGKYYAAWLLNFYALGLGLVIAPRAIYRAFLNGRRGTNLYQQEYSESFLKKRVGELRNELGIKNDLPPSFADSLSFALFSAVSLLLWTLSLTVVVAGPVLAVRFAARVF